MSEYDLIESILKRRGKGRNYNIPSPLSTPKEIVGSHNHRPAGTSIRWPALYRHLRQKGMTKQKAAMISNGLWRKKRGLPPKSVPGSKGKIPLGKSQPSNASPVDTGTSVHVPGPMPDFPTTKRSRMNCKNGKCGRCPGCMKKISKVMPDNYGRHGLTEYELAELQKRERDEMRKGLMRRMGRMMRDGDGDGKYNEAAQRKATPAKPKSGQKSSKFRASTDGEPSGGKINDGSTIRCMPKGSPKGERGSAAAKAREEMARKNRIKRQLSGKKDDEWFVGGAPSSIKRMPKGSPRDAVRDISSEKAKQAREKMEARRKMLTINADLVRSAKQGTAMERQEKWSFQQNDIDAFLTGQKKKKKTPKDGDGDGKRLAKARDADGDGFINDGKPNMRPAPPRTPKPPKSGKPVGPKGGGKGGGPSRSGSSADQEEKRIKASLARREKKILANRAAGEEEISSTSLKGMVLLEMIDSLNKGGRLREGFAFQARDVATGLRRAFGRDFSSTRVKQTLKSLSPKYVSHTIQYRDPSEGPDLDLFKITKEGIAWANRVMDAG